MLIAFVDKAQFIDSLNYAFKHKYSIDARLESRTSFINHQFTSVTGVRLGVAFQRKLRIGGGISWLKTHVSNNFYSTNALGKTDTLTKFLKFVYFCYYIDFVFYKTKRWQLSVPIQLGTGSSWYQQTKSYSFGNNEEKHFLFLYEPGITVQFKLFKWLGGGADFAYRFAFQNSKKSNVHLNSPSLSFKALFWIDQLFYELFPKSELTKKYGPAYW